MVEQSLSQNTQEHNRPKPLPVNFAAIPQELKARRQFVVWRYKYNEKSKDWKKPPYQPSGAHASSTDPSTWTTFDAAADAYRAGGFDGIGFVLTADDPYVGFDFDHCVDDGGRINPQIKAWIDLLDSYTEFSPSGHGVRVFVKASLQVGTRDGGNEIYSHGRYLTLTGQRLDGTPADIRVRDEQARVVIDAVQERRRKSQLCAREKPVSSCEHRLVVFDDDVLLDKARAASNGDKFSRLFDAGDWQADYPSQSEADLALCTLLAFWTRKDAGAIDRLFRRSALYRPKWNELHGDQTYGEMTVAKAVDAVTDVYVGEAMADTPVDKNQKAKRQESKTTQLVDLGRKAELWHTPDKEPYATINVDGHQEHVRLNSKDFRLWLSKLFHKHTGKAVGRRALQDAIDVLGGIALFDGNQHEVYVRVAPAGDKLYLDLADADWRVVQVDATGWRVIQNPPVRFRRTRGMLPLPVPERDGSLDLLRRYVNLDDSDWTLLAAWLIGALHPTGPYPVLVAQGEHGTGKTQVCRMLRALIDPNVAPLRTIPRDERDLMIAARNGWIVAYDNLSGMQAWLSDALCRISTGGGFATRELYQDTDEILIDAKRPIIVNGIDALTVRDDLRDRSIVIDLPRIPEERRVQESHLCASFDADRPKILGGLLDLVAGAFARSPHVHLDRLPRMADFAHWIVASGLSKDFLSIYTGNRQAAAEAGIADDFVAQAIIQLVPWTGTANELLERLTCVVDERLRRTKAWPATPRVLGNRLRRMAPTLRMVGIDVAFARTGKDRTRRIVLTQADDRRTQNVLADDRRTQTKKSSSACNCPESLQNPPIFAVADEADANLPLLAHTHHQADGADGKPQCSSVAPKNKCNQGEGEADTHTCEGASIGNSSSASSAKPEKAENGNGSADLKADDKADAKFVEAGFASAECVLRPPTATAKPPVDSSDGRLVPGTDDDKAILEQVRALLYDKDEK